MENKNTLIAIVLITVIWFGYTLFFPPAPPAPVDAPAAPAATAAAPQVDREPVVVESSTLPAKPVVVEAASFEETLVDTGVLRLTIPSLGGGFRDALLNRFGLTAAEDSPRVPLVGVDQARDASLRLSGTGGIALSENTPYTFQQQEREYLLKDQQQQQVDLATQLPGGLEVIRSYLFTGGHYDFVSSVRLTNKGDQPLGGRMLMSLVNRWSEESKPSMYEFAGPSVFAEESLQQEDVDDLGVDGKSFQQGVLWTAFEEKYFASILVPAKSSLERVRLLLNGDLVENQVIAPEIVLQPGESVEFSYTVFVGPKRVDLLESVGQRIDELVDFGWFAVIAHPLLVALKFFYNYIGNYGVAIILLTVLIKILFWPLTQKSYTSMKSMQKLQPQMQKLREKHKNDRERLNRELMELYKTHRVNPLGGCLPMIVQIPVFFALYKVLLFSIELRHAPFMLWITDLSAKDPYYITPLIMGASMFVQQKMMPSQMDPNQQRIMMMMPVIFTFMFLQFPSGLVLYWLVNNLLTIGQQYLINRPGAEAA